MRGLRQMAEAALYIQPSKIYISFVSDALAE